MIIETIFSTLDPSGKPHFAPMGILWGEEILIVRPFRNTQTYHNLITGGCGVVSVTDDVLAIVQSALYKQILPSFPARVVDGVVYQGACSWREVVIDPLQAIDSGTTERAEITCRIVHQEKIRDFLGLCRAMGAVIEAAILATRLNQYSPEAVSATMRDYAQIVEKTGGENEYTAFRQVQNYIRSEINYD